MILDTLQNVKMYESFSKNMAIALQWMQNEKIDVLQAPMTIKIQGESVFAMVQSYDSLDPSKQRFESHKRYIDIQYVQNGKETILWTPTQNLVVSEEYNTETDNMFYADAPATELKLYPGYFAVFFPKDGHKPRCLFGSSEPIGKIVIKVAV